MPCRLQDYRDRPEEFRSFKKEVCSGAGGLGLMPVSDGVVGERDVEHLYGGHEQQNREEYWIDVRTLPCAAMCTV